MRINKFVAQATGLSRRAADQTIADGRVSINGQISSPGQIVNDNDIVSLDGNSINLPESVITIMINKPVGYVCSRKGQGSQTVYDLLPEAYARLKTVGRLDKDSSGLLLLTSDGNLANELTHPRYAKSKVYLVTLNKQLLPLHHQMISDHGIELSDGNSQLGLTKIAENGHAWQVTMSEGRNRQIRRTFEALGYKVVKLQRTNFGNYSLDGLRSGKYKICN